MRWSITSWVPRSKSRARPIKKNVDAVAAFRDHLPAVLQAVLPTPPAAPIKVWAMDESRLGLHTIRRRRLTARGVKPVGVQQHRFENFYLYGAVAPADGDGWFLGLPRLTAALFQRFVDGFAQAHAATFNILIVDNSRCHTAQTLVLPANVVLVFQPPYAPELNPVERVWLALKDALAWQCFAKLEQLQARVVEVVEAWTADTLRALASYPFLMRAINALSPS